MLVGEIGTQHISASSEVSRQDVDALAPALDDNGLHCFLIINGYDN